MKKLILNLIKNLQNDGPKTLKIKNKEYKISFDIRFLLKLRTVYEDVYGIDKDPLKILNEDLGIIELCYRFKNVENMDDLEKIENVLESINSIALMLVIFSLINDSTLDFNTFSNFSLSDFLENDIQNIAKKINNSVTPTVTSASKKKKMK
jgi:hypothetical protein